MRPSSSRTTRNASRIGHRHRRRRSWRGRDRLVLQLAEPRAAAARREASPKASRWRRRLAVGDGDEPRPCGSSWRATRGSTSVWRRRRGIPPKSMGRDRRSASVRRRERLESDRSQWRDKRGSKRVVQPRRLPRRLSIDQAVRPMSVKLEGSGANTKCRPGRQQDIGHISALKHYLWYPRKGDFLFAPESRRASTASARLCIHSRAS